MTRRAAGISRSRSATSTIRSEMAAARPFSIPPPTHPASRRRVDPAGLRGHPAPHRHHRYPNGDEHQRDYLRHGQYPEKPVILRPEKLDDEPLHPRHHTIHAHEPPLGVLVIA